MDPKKMLAEWVAQRVKPEEIIGVGTGTTVDAAIKALGDRSRAEGFKIKVVTTSWQSTWSCEEQGLAVLSSPPSAGLAWGFDGADAVDRRLRAIKGKGGAMLREKILAAACREYLLLVDQSKLTDNIAAAAAVPVEVVPVAHWQVSRELTQLGAAKVQLRQAVAKHGPVITEAGNIILDAVFAAITDNLEHEIKQIVGVVESGLFLSFASSVAVASSQGIAVLRRDALSQI